MNKIIINFAIVSCLALGSTLAHARDHAHANGNKSASQAATTQINYYEMHDEHGKPIMHRSGTEGVVHPSAPMENEFKGKEFKHQSPHSSVQGA